MRKIRFTEHQIIAVLKSVEVGRTVKDVCREAAVTAGTRCSSVEHHTQALSLPQLEEQRVVRFHNIEICTP